MASSSNRVIVVGGGLAGLATAVRCAEEGLAVDLVSLVPVKRSHSVCAQGGINACNEIARQQGFSEWLHFDETVYGGDFLNNQPPVKEMCDAAPKIIELLDRMGVPFNRTAEGNMALRLFGGSLFKRTFYAGATTGQQLLYALDEQTRRWEAEGRVTKYEFWEFLRPVLDANGVCRGVIIQNNFHQEIRALKADAVVMCTGGNGLLFGKSTMSMICNGAAAGRCYRAGARYANGEFVQVHPTAIPGADKLRLMSESARGEGGRVWVPRKKGDIRHPSDIPERERWYFLEEKYPKYKNIVPRDIATREIFAVCKDGYSVDPENLCVYLDLTERTRKADDPAACSKAVMKKKLGGILEIYEKFIGVDPLEEPMKIFPAVHYSMGGLWVDYEADETTGGLKKGAAKNQMTNVPGLYAAGEADYQYHGANRLGANSLLSCIFSGLWLGPCLHNYLHARGGNVGEAPDALFDSAIRQEKEKIKDLLSRSGDENSYNLHKELGVTMTLNCTVVRNNPDLDQTLTKIGELKERYRKIKVVDQGTWTNQGLIHARALGDMLDLAHAVALGARLRNECRGVHYKPAFELQGPKSDDPAELNRQAVAYAKAFKANTDQWLKTTIATYTPEGPQITYEPVDTRLIPPRPRTYGMKGAEVIDQVWTEISTQKVTRDE